MKKSKMHVTRLLAPQLCFYGWSSIQRWGAKLVLFKRAIKSKVLFNFPSVLTDFAFLHLFMMELRLWPNASWVLFESKVETC